ncbi:MAG: universal stress protein, partial [Chitinophagaceae bacterium]|jgi:nucleotide-binding universal stress UspA family protein|nr:universal stress protein [Chitinophagaceae bacterium]
MKKIVVPTDFSASATSAINYAVSMAIEIDAAIHLFHVYQVPVAVSDVPVVIVSVEELKKNAEEQLEHLKTSLEHVNSDQQLTITTEAIMGNTVDELESLCKKMHPFIVVMGSRGSTGMERILFGSTTLTAIKHLTCPVIVVPPGSVFKGIKKVGFACDFRKVIETTPTHYIHDLVHEFGATLHVLNVDYKNKNFKPETPEESLSLHSLLGDLNPQYHFIENRDIEDGINKFAEENNLDLVITIPKKHKLLDGLFRKSSTRQLVFESHIPVMCIHE